MLNIKDIRNETAHVRKHMFFDSAGSSLMPDCVLKSILSYLEQETIYGGYTTMAQHENAINSFYIEAASLINTNANNIAFANNATDGYVKILSSFDFDEKDVIITTPIDYVSNIMYFIALKEKVGVKIKMIKELDNGDLDLYSLKELIKEQRPKLIAITHVPTNSGIIVDAEAVGEICQEYKIPFLLDACQSIGQINVDVQKIKCDFLSVTGRKFLRGPRGTGFIYISDGYLSKGFSPFSVDGWSADWIEPFAFKVKDSAKRFEHFEKPYAFLIGLKESLKYLNNIGILEVEQRNLLLRDKLEENLLSIQGVKVLDNGSRKSSITTFIKEDVENYKIKQILDSKKVICSVSGKFSALIDFQKKGVDSAIRLSPHYFNTIEEIDLLSNLIDDIK